MTHSLIIVLCTSKVSMQNSTIQLYKLKSILFILNIVLSYHFEYKTLKKLQYLAMYEVILCNIVLYCLAIFQVDFSANPIFHSYHHLPTFISNIQNYSDSILSTSISIHDSILVQPI